MDKQAEDITPEMTEQWLAALKEKGVAKTAKQAAAFLGISEHSMVSMRKEGLRRDGKTTRRTSLAMAAILAGIKPYGE